MGFKCTFTSISAGIPRDDIWAHREGGRWRAEQAVAELLGGAYAYQRQATAGDTYPPDEGFWLGSYGDTLLLSADPAFLEGVGVHRRYGSLGPQCPFGCRPVSVPGDRRAVR